MTMFLSSCHDEEPYTVSGDGSLSPLYFSANLSESSVKTRATDVLFEGGDQLLAYLEHVDGSSNLVSVDMSPSLVTLAVNSSPGHTSITNGNETSSLSVTSVKQGSNSLLPDGQTTLYWDDFSSSSNDINTSGHGIRVKYGYCYNGRTPLPSLTEDTGILPWSVIQDQRTAEKADYKKSDLLWCMTQESVPYQHKLDRLGVTIPYAHAMSKVTLVLIANDGFASTAFSNTSSTLLNMFVSGTMSATDGGISGVSLGSGDNAGKVFMYKNTPSMVTVGEKELPCCTFEALVMPTKELTNGLVFATVTDVEGNNYNITITDNVLKGFNNGVDAGNPDNNTTPVVMKSGVNYKLTITLDKQPQNIVAQITNWTDVEATGTGEIQFGNDVKTSEVDGAESLSNFVGSFDLWRSTTNADHNSYDENSGLAGVNKATTVTYSGGKWANSPEIYWKDGTTPYYFRALAQYFDVEETKTITSIENSFAVEQGKDIVWGTTPKHTGKEADEAKTHDYAKGAAIDPRTGDIPLTFYHAMSKISVKLQTSDDASAVSLAGARISIANLYDGGTIDLTDGSINSLLASKPLPIAEFLAAEDSGTDPKLSQYAVIPQSLVKTKDGIDRVGAVSFYNISELTEIAGQLYITSTLDKVYYTEETAATHNESLEGHVSNGDDMIYTEAQFKALKTSEIPESLFNLFHFGYTYEEFIALDEQPFINFTNEDYETILTVYTGQGCTHNEISAKAYNAKLPGAVKAGDLQGYKVKDGSKTAKPGDLKVNEENPVIKMLIMLKDGTTYTLNLVDCKTIVEGVEKKVEEWERGMHYIYTITLKKEEITFRAMVKDWDSTTGSGNATLDWD